MFFPLWVSRHPLRLRFHRTAVAEGSSGFGPEHPPEIVGLFSSNQFCSTLSLFFFFHTYAFSQSFCMQADIAPLDLGFSPAPKHSFLTGCSLRADLNPRFLLSSAPPPPFLGHLLVPLRPRRDRAPP